MKAKISLTLAITVALFVLIRRINIHRYQNPEPDQVQDYAPPTARIAMICCGERSDQASVLLKSVFLFSQHADLDVFIIADATCGPIMAKRAEQLQLRTKYWRPQLNVVFLPYEDIPGTQHWKVPIVWPCSVPRLFLHKILPESIDAVLYLDTDHLFLSNVTEIWEYFMKEQEQNPYAVMTLADHVPRPSKWQYHFENNVIPIFGNGGVNAGTIFMNLTRMREFHFEKLAYEMYDRYEGKARYGGPAQNVFNFVFGTYKDNATIMDCSYSFHPSHCGNASTHCYFHAVQDGPVCFCWPVLLNGVKLVHAFGGFFQKEGFMGSLWHALEEVPLDSAAVLAKIQVLKDDFRKMPKQCFALTAEVFYRNAEQYLLKMAF